MAKSWRYLQSSRSSGIFRSAIDEGVKHDVVGARAIHYNASGGFDRRSHANQSGSDTVREERIDDMKERGLSPECAVGSHEVTPNVLALGDQVKLGDQPFDWGTVVYLDEEVVRIIRPYVHVSDFSYGSRRGSKLISYLGQEEVTLLRAESRKVEVVFRSTVPE